MLTLLTTTQFWHLSLHKRNLNIIWILEHFVKILLKMGTLHNTFCVSFAGCDRGCWYNWVGDSGLWDGGLYGVRHYPRQDPRLQGHHPHCLLLLLRRDDSLHLHLQIRENWNCLLHFCSAWVRVHLVN